MKKITPFWCYVANNSEYKNVAKTMSKNLEKGDEIWYRIKGDKSPCLVHVYIQEVKGNIIATNSNNYHTSYPTWLDLNRIEIVKTEKKI